MAHVVVLFENYGPYHLARLKGVHEYFQTIGWRVTAVELARSEITYAWKANVENLPYSFINLINDHSLDESNLVRLLYRLWTALAEIQPDAVAIAGYSRVSTCAALVWCLWHRKPAILMSVTKEDDAPRVWWKEKLKQTIIQRFRAALVGGKPQKRYLEKMGLPSESIAVGYNVVGNDAFHPDQIRGLPNPMSNPFFLSVNRFVPKKNLPNLIAAYAAYHQQAGEQAWDLVLCGDGSLRPHLEQQIAQHGLSDSIHLPGFLQQEQLLPYFAHAKCFIHASSQEQWGLVVNEAMAAGLPVLVSERCGCVEDLLVEGVNGWSFDPDNIDQMAELMLKLSSGWGDAEAMGRAALAHIQTFSPRYFAQGLSQAVRYSLRQI